jgi:hypothetical protein
VRMLVHVNSNFLPFLDASFPSTYTCNVLCFSDDHHDAHLIADQTLFQERKLHAAKDMYER